MITSKTKNELYSFLNFYPVSLIVFLSIVIFASMSTMASSGAIPADSITTSPIVGFLDCPDLSANFGDACNDGDSATINDVVNTDCICKGTYPAPANDLYENAEELVMVHDWDDCATNIVYGTTLGATDDMGPFECDSVGGPWPDVFYTFNSGNYNGIIVSVEFITQMDLVISISEASEGGAVIDCNIAAYGDNSGIGADITPQTGALKNTDYVVRISTNSGYEGAGEFSVCLIGQHLCADLYGDITLDPGDPCYGYGGSTGFMDYSCECEPTVGDCSTPFDGGELTLNGTNEVQSIGCIEPIKFVEYLNVFEGDQYTLISDLGGGYQSGYITIRQSGGNVIGQGYSPVTVTAVNDGSIYADYTLYNTCEMTWSLCYDTSIQCITCDYDCPSIGADIGDACDDANPNTSNDVIDGDCNCIGESQSGSLSGTADWNNSCGDRGLTVKFYAPGTATLLYSYTTTIDENGDFDLVDSIAAGNYDIYAKIDAHLAKSYLNAAISEGANTLLLGSFIAGDLNNNNSINFSDLSVLNISFGSIEGDANYNYMTDMNCDGKVNFVEASILNIGYGKIGAKP